MLWRERKKKKAILVGVEEGAGTDQILKILS